MDKLYEEIKKDTKIFINNLDTEKMVGYAKNFGKLIGLEKKDNRIYVSPQYVLASHLLYPYYTGRVILFTSTAAFVMANENN